MNTSMPHLLQLGLHITVSEPIEGHLSGQRLHLTPKPAALALLKTLHLPCQSTTFQPLPHN